MPVDVRLDQGGGLSDCWARGTLGLTTELRQSFMRSSTETTDTKEKIKVYENGNYPRSPTRTGILVPGISKSLMSTGNINEKASR